MSDHRSGPPSYLGYCLLAVILFGCYVLFNRFQDDNSATMAPNLTLNRYVSRAFSFGNRTGSWLWVIFRPRAASKPSPFVPQQRTSRDYIGKSVSCQFRKWPLRVRRFGSL